mmetsp:Transcript_7073/g.17537  ORF Transcript_7073/g.17537 Transcript_7073/m.17537 type:complete len:260 (-) Transcript_7073:473-1252(-)
MSARYVSATAPPSLACALPGAAWVSLTSVVTYGCALARLVQPLLFLVGSCCLCYLPSCAPQCVPAHLMTPTTRIALATCMYCQAGRPRQHRAQLAAAPRRPPARLPRLLLAGLLNLLLHHRRPAPGPRPRLLLLRPGKGCWSRRRRWGGGGMAPLGCSARLPGPSRTQHHSRAGVWAAAGDGRCCQPRCLGRPPPPPPGCWHSCHLPGGLRCCCLATALPRHLRMLRSLHLPYRAHFWRPAPLALRCSWRRRCQCWCCR